MVIGIVDQAIIGEQDPLGIAEFSVKANVTLIIFPALGLRQAAFVIAEVVTADAHAGGYLPEVALGIDPAQILGLFFRYVIPRQFPVQVQVGAAQMPLVEENMDLLSSLGFEIAPFGADTITVRLQR